VRKVDAGSKLAEAWHHGAFMEIFVRAYKDSDGDGEGDLRGVTQSLDYLRELGIKGIWLMPITRSADGDHGYAVTDFRSIDPRYGTLADFDELIREAHKRGIGVIMDYVINHSSARSPMFMDAVSTPSSKYRDWYVWKDPAPQGWDIWGKNPWYTSPSGTYYGTFGVNMPDFNLENPATLTYHLDSLRFWLNRGLDGFRFDAVPHLIETDAQNWNDQPGSYAVMGQIKALMDSYQRRFPVCEATAMPQRWAAPYICGAAFAFDLNTSIVKAARGESEHIIKLAEYFNTAPRGMATFIHNHDAFTGGRVWDQLKGNEAQYRLAAASYLLLPGTPFIYFGEEIGMSGGAGLQDDYALRSPMSWSADASTAGFTHGTPFRAISANAATHNVAVERKDANSLFAFYKALLSLRNTLPSIARGSYEGASSDGQTLQYHRKLGNEHSVVAINYASSEANIELDGLVSNARLSAAYPASGAAISISQKGTAIVHMPPQSVRVFIVN
jgi:glycosidase